MTASTYDARTIDHPHPLVRAVHRMRYRAAVRAILGSGARSVLDYGAGTGSLLRALQRAGTPLMLAAFEPGRNAETLRAKLPTVPVYTQLRSIPDTFDLIACTGVMEHLPYGLRMDAYAAWRKLLAPWGSVLVQVPVMLGAGVVLRELGRLAFKGRSPYTPGELFRLGLCRVPDDGGRMNPGVTWTLPHRGFDHRRLVREMETEGFAVVRTFTRPPVGAYFAHSIYFVARAR